MKKLKWMTCYVLSSLLLSGCNIIVDQTVDESVETVVTEQVVTREATGKVVIEEETHFYLDFEAEVVDLLIKEGQVVSKGDILMKLDLSTYQTLLQQKTKEEKMYEIDLKAIGSDSPVEQVLIDDLTQEITEQEQAVLEESDSEIKRIEAAKIVLEAQRAQLEKDYEALEELYAIGAAAQSELDACTLLLTANEGDIQDLVLQKEAFLVAKTNQIEAMKIERTQLEIQLANKEEAERIAREKLTVQLEMTRLQKKALEEKFDKPYLVGEDVIALEDEVMVYDLAIQKGTKTETVLGPAFKTMAMNEKVIIAEIPEAYSDELAIGQKVQIIPYTDEDRVLEGTVRRMSEQAIEYYGEIIVETMIEIDESEQSLKVGSTVDIIF